jgi:peptidoglycan hydrolase CwlO-like protein
MVISKDRLLEEFLKNLDATNLLVQQLLEEIRESDVDLATLKIELKNLIDDVKEINSSFKDNEHEVIELRTKILLLEKNLEEVNNYIKDKKSEENSIKISDNSGKWQIIVAIVTGLMALLGIVLSLLSK